MPVGGLLMKIGQREVQDTEVRVVALRKEARMNVGQVMMKVSYPRSLKSITMAPSFL